MTCRHCIMSEGDRPRAAVGGVRVLAPEVSSHIRSGQSLDSITQCVLELVRNSVDAQTSTLLVRVDTSSWRIQVSDDGHGISREDLSLVGDRYATSKCRELQDLQHTRSFGFHGEALASIVQVAQRVEVTSRHRHSQLTYCKRFQDGHSVGVASPARGLSRAGTVVAVHNLFYNLPVRRRQMSPIVETERVRHALSRALLALTCVSLSLHDDRTGERLLHISPASSILRRYHQLFTGRSVGIQATSVHVSGVKMSALLSVTAQSNSLQLIFCRQRQIESQSLHVLVCQLLEPITAQHRTRDKRARGSWQPFYVIAIDSDMQSDICPNTASAQNHFYQEQKLVNGLTVLIHSFLSDNHFTPHHNPPSPAVLSAAVTASSSCRNRETTLSTTSSCRNRETTLSTTSSCKKRETPLSTTSSCKKRETTLSTTSSCKKRETTLSTTSTSTTNCQPPSELPTILKTAVDPATRRAFYLHPVTGCTHTIASAKLNSPLTAAPLTCSSVQQVPTAPLASSSVQQVPTAPLASSSVQHVPSVRVQSALTPSGTGWSSLLPEWKNPTFSAGDGAVLALETSRSYKSLVPYKFSRCSLNKVEVLGQVDKKFIVCLLASKTPTTPPLLVAVDQHAAHERVRLEALVQGVYDEEGHVRVSSVDPPLPLYLTPSQERMARCFSDKLAAIGVALRWMDGRVFAGTLPAILTERLVCGQSTVASVVQQLVQSHLQCFQTDCWITVLERTGGGGGTLPSSGLTDVLHSWACHGAIRFGDELSLSECKQLVGSLASCSLPFQCAHGRPSLAPLVDLCMLAQRAPGLQTPFPDLRRLPPLFSD